MLSSRPAPTYGLSPRGPRLRVAAPGTSLHGAPGGVASFCDWSLAPVPDQCRTQSAARTVSTSAKYCPLQTEKLHQNDAIFSGLTKGEQSIVNGINQNKRDPEKEEKMKRESRRRRGEKEAGQLEDRGVVQSAPSKDQTLGVFKLPSYHQETRLPHGLLGPRSKSLDVESHHKTRERLKQTVESARARMFTREPDQENRKAKTPIFLHKFCGMDDLDASTNTNHTINKNSELNTNTKDPYYHSGKLTARDINQVAHQEYTTAIERNAKVLLNYKLPNLTKHKTNLRISLTGDPTANRGGTDHSHVTESHDATDKKQEELKQQLGLNHHVLQLEFSQHGKPHFCKRDLYNRFTKPLVRQVSGSAMLPVRIESQKTPSSAQDPFRWLPIISCMRNSGTTSPGYRPTRQEGPYKLARDPENSTSLSSKPKDAVDVVAAANYMNRKPIVTACPPPNTPVPTQYPDTDSDRESSVSGSSYLDGETWNLSGSQIQYESEIVDDALSINTGLSVS